MGKKKKTIEPEESVQSSEPVKEEVIQIPQILIKTPEQMFREEFNRAKKFQIYHGNDIIFDSDLGSKDKIIFVPNGFQIFNKIYSYNGIRLKLK